MSHYVFQFFALLLAAVAFSVLRQGYGGNPAPIRNGFYVVRWSIRYLLINGAFLIAMLSACIYFLWLEFATDEKGVAVIWFLLIPLLTLAFWGTLSWRVRNEYNDTTLIAYPMTGKPRQFELSDFTMAGPISWRGHEFSTEACDKVYANTYQTGAPDSIDLPQRKSKQTYPPIDNSDNRQHK